MFQVQPLAADQFAHLKGLSDDELSAEGVQIHISDGAFPCRVSLADAAEGERVFLLNFEHQPGQSPYKSRHAIFVKESAEERYPEQGEIPASITSRLLSVRAFNAHHEIVDADVVEGVAAAEMISRFFSNPKVDYIHLHYAKRGCYAAKVIRPNAWA